MSAGTDSSRRPGARTIMQLVTRFDPGGAQAIAIDLARHQAEVGHRVLLAGGAGGAGEPWLDDLGCERLQLRHLIRPISPFRDLLAVWELAAALRRHRVDVLHSHTSKAGLVGRLAAALAGTPAVIHTAHGWAFHPLQSAARRQLYIALERLVAPLTSRLVAVSQATRQRGLAAGIGTAKRYETSYCGVEVDAYRVGDPEALVGCVACLKPQKAPGEFLHIAAALKRRRPALRFQLVGDGPLRPEVEALGQQLGVEVDLPGWCFDVPERLGRYALLILTSRFEGLPLVVLEAMACGVPVLATAVDGTPEAIPPDVGSTYHPGDVEDALRKAEALLDRGPSAERGRAHVAQHFARRSHLEQMTALAESLARPRHRRRWLSAFVGGSAGLKQQG